jgi:uroporphyrinogen III methyltransferase/synthase
MVYLVGAGPGDYRLLTLKAADCLQKAEVVVYDRLADERILRYAPEEAEYIYVGKASSHHTMKQPDISQLLVDKAQAGKCVVRLKGGDPFVFGRGGEEALLLEKNHLPFEIVPGVTSAISVPAYAGIPVTQRAVATSFAVVTGHEDPTKPGSQIRWDKLSTGVDTLVFLMGVGNLPKITSKLIENGRPASTPAAVIRWGTKPEQRVLMTTVGQAAADAAQAGLKPPAIFLVGEVAKLRRKLAWFDNPATHPLFGRTVLVTRARAQASQLTEKLEALGARVVELPAIRLQPPAEGFAMIDLAIKELDSYDWLIFTSTNGVSRFFERLYKAGRDTRAVRQKVAAIGSATAAKLREHGIIADAVPQEYRAEGIIKALQGKLQPGERILIPRAKEAREILPDALREMGAVVNIAPVYETVAAEIDGGALAQRLAAGEFDIVTFTSSSTVKNLVQILGGTAALQQTSAACIGPVTAETCRQQGLEPALVAGEYTLDGLVKAISSYLQKGSQEQ